MLTVPFEFRGIHQQYFFFIKHTDEKEKGKKRNWTNLTCDCGGAVEKLDGQGPVQYVYNG